MTVHYQIVHHLAARHTQDSDVLLLLKVLRSDHLSDARFASYLRCLDSEAPKNQSVAHQLSQQRLLAIRVPQDIVQTSLAHHCIIQTTHSNISISMAT